MVIAVISAGSALICFLFIVLPKIMKTMDDKEKKTARRIMRRLFLCMSVFTVACSTNQRLPTARIIPVKKTIEIGSTTIVDDHRLLHHLDLDGGIGEVSYRKLMQEKRINQVKKYSCFNSSRSVNYLDLSDVQISYYRIFSVAVKHSEYKIQTKIKGGELNRHAVSNTQNTYFVGDIKKCFKKIGTRIVFIVSEVY